MQNPALFPAFVAQHSVSWDLTDPREVGQQFPGVALPVSLERAVRKRQVEFVAGRYCAREALRQCAPELADDLIGIGPNNEPLWPSGVVGAITHTDRQASVALARTHYARGIGVDAEIWIAATNATSLADQIAGREELGALRAAVGCSLPRAVTLIFSAKEALFKCFFPHVKRYFDFRDVCVQCLDATRGRLLATLSVSLAPTFRAGSRYEMRFDYDERLVYTGIWLPPR